MTERKPLGMRHETWVERQIREAERRGAFEDLPGAGKPIPGRGKPDGEHWWIRQKLAHEQLTYLPPTLLLRKRAEDTREAALFAPSERTARRLLEELNVDIRAAIFLPPAGPPLNLVPVDVERALAERRARIERAEAPPPLPAPPASPRRRRWWRRRSEDHS